MGGGAGGWLQAFPAVVAAGAWLVVPGLAVTLALGLRGLTAVALAPPVAVAAIAASAIGAGTLKLAWSPLAVLVPAVVVAAVVAAVRFGAHRFRRTTVAREADGRRPAVAAAAGLAGAVALTLVTAHLGMGAPDALSQTYDAVFHYNAVAQVLATGNASSLAVGTLNNPTAASAFYPAAWHDVVSLVVLTTGTSIPLASNAVAIAVTGLVWPLGCLALVRRVIGRSTTAALVTPPVAVGFLAFPWSLMTFGVLWPNLLGLALVPAGLALVAALLRIGSDGDAALTRTRTALLLGVTAVALVLSHPNAVLSLGALAAPLLLWAQLRWLTSLGRTGRRWLVVAIAVVAVLTVTAVGWFLATSPLFDGVRAYDWPAYQSPPQAAGEVLLNATEHKDAAWALSIVVVVGFVVALRRFATSWLVPAHLIAGGLFVLASALETPTAALLTGFWYNDPYRLAAMVPITGVPLAVLGVQQCGSLLGDLRFGRPAVTGPPEAWSEVASNTRGRLRRSTVGACVVLVVLGLASSGLYVRDHAEFLRSSYPPQDAAPLVNTAERAFFARVAAEVPPDSVVAQNPWSGSALLWALDGDRVLFPHMAGSWSPDQLVLAARLRDAATDPGACAAAQRLHVGYLLVGRPDFWPRDPRAADYPGLVAPGTGFQLVADDGVGNQLYRLTACATG